MEDEKRNTAELQIFEILGFPLLQSHGFDLAANGKALTVDDKAIILGFSYANTKTNDFSSYFITSCKSV
jgi:hypothetical protein